jgi:hypothetical protein
MKLNIRAQLCLLLFLVLCSSTALCDSIYDRELIVQDKTRAMQVESVFKEMMAAYEDEDARGFLDHVSDERFRQDYITFTDALYSDFRNYEIHQVDYWIDRVVPDNVKQFLFVHWEKRYENLDDGRQITRKGVSRFLFDEVDGRYLLIELAGNNLFGGSLQEWVEEVPQIAGQIAVAGDKDNGGNDHGGGDGNDDGGGVPVAPELPDLLILDAKWEPNYAGALEGALSFVVRNIGLGASGPCLLGVGDATIVEIPPLEPQATFSTELGNVPHEMLTVDVQDTVEEEKEDNNTFMPAVRQ